ncbi:MAG TPA: lipopolysaccharide heptosyltransferase II [Candidatus Krumholzibacteria bacterium]|nr:lipopolysaccharide heptosyltransferase II [Candidatus Krumholzibacteria bacterium]HPD71734.1 lipopolysaccharide heptosyltransferase II [Candidatus Krumholzibacteria bacterium]HRY41333.1 lipopolysaccharide heptosyltransferase II [Candidatus Krumholzibacteria bacterium]
MITDGRQGLRVLVVLPNWLGDVVMATPLLDVLHETRDDRGRPLAIVASVRRRWAPLLARDPRLAKVVLYERTGCHAGVRGIPRLAATWRAAGAAAVVVCPPSLRSALVARLARIPRRIGYAGEGRSALLTLPLAPVRPRGSVHHVDELRRLGLVLLESLGLPQAEAGAAMPRLPGLDDLYPASIGSGPPLWIFAPGATYGPAKTWTVERAAEFTALAVREEGVRLAVVGDTATAGFLAALRRRVPDLPWRRELAGPAGVIDLVGGTTVLDLAALIKRSRGFVGNDSGVMHLAAALGVPTVGLFGSSSTAWTGPRGACTRALVASGFPCQPCYRRTCNQPVFCLDTLSGQQVLAALKDLRDATSPGARP